MHAFYLHGAKDLRLADIDPPESSADQVLRICATGICGSDLHHYEHGRNGDFIPARPFIWGTNRPVKLSMPALLPTRFRLEPAWPLIQPIRARRAPLRGRTL